MIGPAEPAGCKFSLGWKMITAEARAVLPEAEILGALGRHAQGDWGDLDAEDQARNDVALFTEGRLFSVYSSVAGGRFYIITEGDRSMTTILLPHEY